jgi:hypothetical protein
VLTLYVTPVFFVYMEAFQEKVRSLFGKHKKEGASQIGTPIGG